jgi:hypothetical protein
MISGTAGTTGELPLSAEYRLHLAIERAMKIFKQMER